MSNPNADDKILALRRELAAQRRACLQMPPEEALVRILEHPQPAALVHSLPEEDFYFLIQDIGPDDAHPLIALGSQRQLEYLLDQNVWSRDRIDIHTLFLWLERLVASDPARMVRWLAAEKSNLVEYYLFNSIAIRMRQHDQDPAEFGPDFVSFDNFFYIRILDLPTTAPLGEALQKRHHRLVHRILEGLADEDHANYQRLLLAAMNVLPAEAEEEAYRLRNVRLAEKGFLPFEEAVGLYQPTRFDRFPNTAARFRPLPEAGETRLPMVPITLLDDAHLFSRALQTITPGEALDQLQAEFAALCNRISVADRLKIERRDDLRAVVHKACGYLNIGLERLDPETPSSAAAARSVQAFTLEGLFRLGYSEAVHLKQAAEGWVATSWFAGNGLPLTFWGEIWLGVVGGLLLKRPRFFTNDRSGPLYREFKCLAEIQATGRQLARVRAFDHLLEQMQIDLPPRGQFGHLTYKSVLLTLWARSTLGLPETLRPIPLDVFGSFWDSLFRRPAPTGAGRGTIADRHLAILQQWLARRTNQDPAGVAQGVGPALEALLDELEEEYGRVFRTAIDPRYISHFLLESEDSGGIQA
ncbi:MAG: DUF6178 family protein [Desulfobacterales bacterium]|nr:DUF6178 family protein [Desulfobacterales bacterium]